MIVSGTIRFVVENEIEHKKHRSFVWSIVFPAFKITVHQSKVPVFREEMLSTRFARKIISVNTRRQMSGGMFYKKNTIDETRAKYYNNEIIGVEIFLPAINLRFMLLIYCFFSLKVWTTRLTWRSQEMNTSPFLVWAPLFSVLPASSVELTEWHTAWRRRNKWPDCGRSSFLLMKIHLFFAAN